MSMGACADAPNIAKQRQQDLDQMLRASDLNAALDDRLVEVFGSLEPLEFPRSNQYDQIPQSDLNPLTSPKVQLGQLLYHETAMAQSSETGSPETYACASCHFAGAGFQANQAQAVADGGRGFSPRVNAFGEASDVQPVRTPSAMNTAFQELMLWNGQFGGGLGNDQYGDPDVDFVQLNAEGLPGLEVQAIKGLEVHRMGGGAEAVAALTGRYGGLFRAVFGDGDDAVSRRNAGLAIAAFERTLLASEAPFQRWLRGEGGSVMTDAELRGALVFFSDQTNCAACHSGPALNSMSFHALGMGDLDDAGEAIAGDVPEEVRLGRGGFTGEAEDDFKFKTPQLYNLADSPFYGHGATFTDLAEVVAYKNEGVAWVPNDNLSADFVPLGLSDEEMADLVVFLESALYDPDLARYEPQRLPSGNCFPVNDDEAYVDLGCE